MMEDPYRLCPNCNSKEIRPFSGVGAAGNAFIVHYPCGYVESVDGIEPPTIPPACRIIKTLREENAQLKQELAWVYEQ